MTTYSTNIDLRFTDAALLFLRIGIGALMLTHGYPKLVSFFGGGEIQFADPIGLGPEISLLLAVFAEFICSILLILGLATRLASIPLIITMLVAIFIVHAADPFQNKEMAVIYLLVFTFLLMTGAGKFSLDYLWGRKKSH